MNKKIFVYTLIFTMNLQVLSPALAASTGAELPDIGDVANPASVTADEQKAAAQPAAPTVADGKVDSQLAKPADMSIPACPDTQSKDEMSKKIDVLENKSKTGLFKLSAYHRAAGIPTDLEENMLKQFSASMKNYCSKKIDIIAEKSALSPLALARHQRTCGEFAPLIQKYKAFEDGITKSQEELENARKELYFKKFVPARDQSKALLKQKLSQCLASTNANTACPNAGKVADEREAVWGVQPQGKPTGTSLFNMYLKAFEAENTKIAAQKAESEKKRAKLEETCKSLGSPIGDPAVDPAVDPALAGGGSKQKAKVTTNCTNCEGGTGQPGPVIEQPQGDTSGTTTGETTGTTTGETNGTTTGETSGQTTGTTTGENNSKGNDNGKKGGGWLSSPWLWGGIGAAGAGGLTYYFMNKKVEDEQNKKMKAKIALQEERLKNLNNPGTTTGSADGTTNGTTNGTSDGTTDGTADGSGGTQAGCNLSLVGAPGTAAVNMDLPPIDISIINPDGKISTRDNTTNISMTCSGCSSMSGPSNVVATAGVAKFTGIKFGAADKGVTLNFTGGNCNQVTSGAINVSEPGARE